VSRIDPAKRWAEIDAMLAAALERPALERRQFVRENTRDDPELAAAVTDLLEAVEAAASFLERPIAIEAEELVEAFAAVAAFLSERAGRPRFRAD
jgi:hypothetical protein